MVDFFDLPAGQAQDRMPNFGMVRSAPGPYVEAGDSLRLRATTTDATGVLTVNYRMFSLANHAMVSGTFQMTFSGTGVQTAVSKALTEGWLIGFIVYVSSGTITDGEVQASVDIIQGEGSAAFPVMNLASGEVTNVRSLGMGAYTCCGAGPGLLMTELISANQGNPAAGERGRITVPSGQTWELYQVNWQLITDANVADRHISVEFYSITDAYVDFYAPAVTPASTTVSFFFGRGVTAFAAPGAQQVFGFPVGYLLTPGTLIDLNVENIQVGDQVSGINYTYRRLQ